ncbi:unnamed protein product [Phaedon cochleariae]|uniref:Peroxidase n=1 Tax=Phaedon cochleariae TaxID=80249 RepID=A0A9N9X2Q7_PHACE|nr:unnamed protein product [Phaedon cochleariae]
MLQKTIWTIFLQIFLLSFKENLAQRDSSTLDSFFDDIFSEPHQNSRKSIFSENSLSNYNDVFTFQPPTSTTPDPRTLGCGTPPHSCGPNAIYRSYDGACNNLRNPIWGIPNTPYRRLLPANYGDGISLPTTAKGGRALPLARSVSLALYPDVPIFDPIYTLNLMQYSQIVTHDMSRTIGSSQTRHYKTRCCSPEGQLLELAESPDHCFPIVLPDNDPAHSKTKTKCMSFDRSITNKDRNCVEDSTPADQLTSVNHYLDLSLVYGNDAKTSRLLRQFQNGRLRTEHRSGQQWLPRATNASQTCRLLDEKDACYMAGDSRVNQSPHLALLQTIYVREHNRLAASLSALNPHWPDERVFQEARKINMAAYQHVTYYEWLPHLVGRRYALGAKLIYDVDDHVDDYDEKVDPTVLNEHATAAFRHFHSMIVGHLHLVSEHRTSQGRIRLSDVLRRPQILEEKHGFEALTRGLSAQLQSASDQYHDSEITQYLFRGDNETFGIDLKAFDIQRARDHGLATYNDFRVLWGLPRARRFEDFLDWISEENVRKLATLYADPEDVDLSVGGSLERPAPGALVGPTFLRILIEQFSRTRRGDRYWYENAGKTGFSDRQLIEIRKASVSRLLCDNTGVEYMQPRGFEKLFEGNPLVKCEQLPSMDLSKWKETKSDQYGSENFMNRAFNFITSL